MNYKNLIIGLFSIALAKAAYADVATTGCVSNYLQAAKYEESKAEQYSMGRLSDNVGFFSITTYPLISSAGSSHEKLAEENMKIAQMLSESYTGDGLELRRLYEQLVASNTTLEFDEVVKAVWTYDNNLTFCLRQVLTYAQIQELLTKSLSKKK